MLWGCLGLASGESVAPNPSEKTETAFSLQAYLALAAENNPNLKASFNRYLAALEKVPQMGSLPDPTATFGIFIEPMERYAGDQIGSISLMQMFPWFGTLGAARHEAAQMAKAEYHAFREIKHQLFFEVKSAWLDLYLLEQEIKVMQKNVETLKSLEKIALIQFSSGGSGSDGGMSGGGAARPSMSGGGAAGMDAMGSTGSMQGMGGNGMASRASGSNAGAAGKRGEEGMSGMDGGSSGGMGMVEVLWVQMEVKETESSLLALLDRRVTLTARCNQLLGRASQESISLPNNLEALEWPANMAEAIASGNPMLEMLEAEEKAFAYQEKMNRKMGLPMVGLGLQYDIFRAREGGSHGGEGGEGHNMLMPMVSVSLPIWRGKYRAAAKESAMQRKAIEARKQETRNALQVEHMEIKRDFHDAARRMELYQAQKNVARQALNILTAQYTATGKNVDELLRMQKKEREYALQWERAVVDNHLAVARAERLMALESDSAEKTQASGRNGSKGNE